MKKVLFILSVMCLVVFSTACVNNLAVQELNNKAKVFMDKGDYENAISRLQASIDLDDSIFETQYNLGVAYTYADKYNEAIETFDKAINLKPDMPETYYSLGVAQENFAIDIVKGILKPDGKPYTQEEIEEASSDDQPALSDESMDKIKILYNNAIQSYETYLQKAGKPKDRANVEAKISNIKTELEKLDNPNLTGDSSDNAYNQTLKVE